MKQEIEKFKNIISPYKDIWKSIELRVVAAEDNQKWLNLGTVITLRTQKLEECSPHPGLPNPPSLKTLHVFYNIPQLDTMLNTLQEGVLQIEGTEVHYKQIEGRDLKSPHHLSYHSLDRGDRYYPTVAEYKTFFLSGRGSGIGQERLEKFNDLLRTGVYPYDGLRDLFEHFLQMAKEFDPPTTDFINILAPLPVRLHERTRISEGKLEILIDADRAINLSEISVGLILFGRDTPVDRSKVDFTVDDWISSNGLYKSSKEVDVSNCPLIKVFLSYRGLLVDQEELYNPAAVPENPRILVHNFFDQDLKTFSSYLRGEGKNPSEDFELCIGWLLSFCGFSPLHYGLAKRISEEIDIIAFSPATNEVIAAECTLRDIDVNSKLAKLSRRVKELQAVLTNWNVLPVIFTALESDKISSANLETAKKEHIVVTSRQETIYLLEMAEQNKGAPEIFRYLHSLLQEHPLLSVFKQKRRSFK